MIEFDLRHFLSTRAEIQEYIGSAPARVFPVKAPQKVARPYITFRRLSGGRAHTLAGAAGYAIAKFEISSVANSDTKGYETAKLLAFAVCENMQGFGGELKHLYINGITADEEEDVYADPTDGSDNGTFEVVQVYAINYKETHKNTEK